MTKQLITLISSEGKNKEELLKEALQNFQKYEDVKAKLEKQQSEEQNPESKVSDPTKKSYENMREATDEEYEKGLFFQIIGAGGIPKK